MIRHHARGVSLTNAGKQLVTEAKSLLAHAEELQESTKGQGNNLRAL